jgi:hypothetical protein
VITVACVLRTGGVYTREWVHALKRGLNRHLAGFEFVCLTDDASVEPCWRLPMRYPFPRWWAKMGLFQPGLFSGPVLYIDLDSLVIGYLAELASYRGQFAMISDFYRPHLAQSGVMAFTPGDYTAGIWELWMRDPASWAKQYRGDGEFLNAHTHQDRLQDLYPGQIRSFKTDHGEHGPAPACDAAPPAGARLLCFHGRPKVTDLPTTHWARKAWEAL